MGDVRISVPEDSADLGERASLSTEPLAVIGVACRFAGDATDSESLWRFLSEGSCAVGPLPEDRFKIENYYHPDPEHGGTSCTTRGYFLKDSIYSFDAAFFKLSENDINAMDPQQKLLLENVYHALENAGLSTNDVACSRTSVFVGSSNNDHLALANGDLEMRYKNKATGTSPSILANRISWFYDLRGTSQTIDTACSSSLVAFHQGCLSVRAGEAEMSIISGVNVIEHPAAFLQLTNLGVLSPDGQSFSFDHRANGYGRGEGVSTLIVKPLRSAIRDGNTIRALVRATGTNHDGKTPGITLPSQTAQAALIQSVYANAHLDMNQTAYVEAHGTGTQVGDPLEVEGIVSAFNTRSRQRPLYIGSIKAGLGHLEGGAGLAGLVKAVLMIESGAIPPTVNLEKVNPNIPTDANIQFARGQIPWPCDGVRRVSVNSFGFGGTNAHVVLDDADKFKSRLDGKGAKRIRNGGASEESQDLISLATGFKDTEDGNKAHVFVLSSSDEQGLRRASEKLEAHLKLLIDSGKTRSENQYLANLAFTLSEKRSPLRWRSSFVASSLAELSSRLTAKSRSTFRSTTGGRIGFVFTGQGAQWSGMGSGLMIYPVFRKSIEDASSYIEKLGSPWLLKDVFEGSLPDLDANHPLLSQSAGTALQVALVDLLASWNILPHVVVGHSSGEVAAAYCAGGISREAAWKVGYYRGYVCAKQHDEDKGALMAVGASEEVVGKYLKALETATGEELQVACFNSPKNFTVTGMRRNIVDLRAMLEKDGIFSRVLPGKVAYHSTHMEVVAKEYASLLGDLSPGRKPEGSPEIRLVSSLKGTTISPNETARADYWVQHLLLPVRFIDSLIEACSDPDSDALTSSIDDLVEIGPHSALRSAIRETLSTASHRKAIRYSHVVTRGQTSNLALLEAIGALHCRGYSVDLFASNFPLTASGFAPSSMLNDLPPYCFNHEKTYRTESRLISNVRNRSHPKQELFGSRALDWVESEPRWRNTIRPSEMPWLRQNKMNGKIIFPGVGYLLTAVEAAKQVADPARRALGYRLRDVFLIAALVVPDTSEGIETALSFQTANEDSSDSQSWKFSIKSHDQETDRWTEHCTGYVTVEYVLQNNEKDSGYGSTRTGVSTAEELLAAIERCPEEVDVEQFYRKLDALGVEFGPMMRNLRSIRASMSSDECGGVVTAPNVVDHMPMGYILPHIIHPITMESMTHILLLICKPDNDSVGSEMLTTYMEEVWLSADISNLPGHSFQSFGFAKRVSRTKWSSNVRVWDDTSKEEQITFKGIHLSLLSTKTEDGLELSPCYGVRWHLCTDLLTTATALQDTTQGEVADKGSRGLCENYQLVSALMISKALDEAKLLDLQELLPYHQQMYKWMQSEASRIADGSDPFLDVERLQRLKHDEAARKELYEQVKNANPRGELLVRIGENLIPIFQKEVDPLELMFGEANLMPRTYDEGFPGDVKSLLTRYLQAHAFNHPNLEIIEVGAGTGSATQVILEALGSRTTDGVSGIGRYHFTDLSGGFLERARKRFSAWSALMDYGILNIERDPSSQGFQTGGYDVVVATHVLHATADLQKTLVNVRSLLKPGGKLLLIENMQPNFRCTPFAFGVLPGWWTSIEPYRALNPLIGEDRWNGLLGKSGFTSNNLTLRDTEDSSTHEISVVVATAMLSETEAKLQDWQSTLAVCASDSQLNSELVSSLTRKLNRNSVGLQTCNFRALRNMDLRNTFAIVLLDLDSFDISTLTEDEYENIKHLLSTCTALVWVSGDELSNPKLSMSTGIIRTVRWERDLDNINFSILRFRNPVPPSESLSDKIVDFCSHAFDNRLGLEKNGEFIVRDDSLWTNRLLHSSGINDFINSKFTQATHLQLLGRGLERPLKSMIRQPRSLASLEFIEDKSQLSPLKPTEVKILVQACGLSSRDLMAVSGERPGDSLGGEASGIVTEVGETVTNLKVGDRVMAINHSDQTGSLQSTFRSPAAFVQKIPDDVDHVEAAGVPIAFCAAFHALHNIARLKSTDTLLVHSAAGGIGQAAIQLAKLTGADIFATVSTVETRELLISEYGVKEDHIFFSGDVSFERGIIKLTSGRGIDVVLNLFRGGALRAAWRCMAPLGRFVDFGVKDILPHGTLEKAPFSRNATYAGLDVSLTDYAASSTVSHVFEEVAQLYRSRKIHCPQPLNKFSYADLNKALSQLQADNVVGKLAVVPAEEDLVPQKSPEMAPHSFPSDASYILAGGLGGLGRSISRWMASRGAKNFIFISRSGGRSDAAQALIQELNDQNCQVKVIVSDVSDRQQLLRAVKPCMLSMPPVKGCFQCSMVLQDALFANMTHAQFNAVVKPKVQGSLNLIEVLPKSIDFFICLSSAAAIVGNRGQANYVAANTFQDALAEHLVLKGIPGLSINLGSVLSVGWVAENQQNLPISVAFGTLSEVELLSIIEYHLDPRFKAAASVETCHTIAGLRSSAYFSQRGLPPPAFMCFPFFSHLLTSEDVRNSEGEKEVDFPINEMLKTADSLQAAGYAIAKAIGWKLSRVMSIPTEDIDLDRSLTSYGVDSLVTVDFRTWIATEMAANVQSSVILSEKSISQLGAEIATLSSLILKE